MTRDAQSRWSQLLVVGALLVFSMVGCSGDDSDPCEDVVCGEDEQCVDGVCVGEGETGCEPACASGERCDRGRCVSEGGGCDEHGQACAAGDHLQWDDGHLCLDWTTGLGSEAVCSQSCQAQPCPTGSECFLVVAGFDVACDTDDDCGDHELCRQGQCMAATCRPSDCELRDGLDADCDDGERCDRIGTSADYCIPAGTKQPGESCIDGLQALEEERFADGCVPEAVCIGGMCQPYCDDGQCSDEQQGCVSRSVEGTEVDICVATCEPGDEETGCAPMETCVPTADGDGICQAAGEVEAFEACDPDGEACEPGTICAIEESGQTLRRCLPVCDLSAGQPGENGQLGSDAQAARDETCPQPEQPPGLWMMWHLAEAGEAVDLYVDGESEPVAEVGAGEVAQLGTDELYQRRDAGRVDWEVRSAGAPSTDNPVAEGGFDLGSGQKRLLMLVPEPGRDLDLQSETVTLESTDVGQWVQAIPDLATVDVWAVGDGEDPELWFEEWSFAEARSLVGEPGTYELNAVESGVGPEEEPEVQFAALEVSAEHSVMALRGTMNQGDIHNVDPPLEHDEPIPDLASETGFPLSCRAVNDGAMGGCIEDCAGRSDFEVGLCRGEQMGCGPRRHLERGEWSTVCQPVGTADEGEPCQPGAAEQCAEGLYCEEYGSGAEHVQETGLRGLCTPLCFVADGERCGPDRGCRVIDEFAQYPIGECRHQCVPDSDYRDAECPAGKQRCKPEGRLVPIGDGVETAFDVEEQQPFCWPSGDTEVGGACIPGDCEPDGECLYERSNQAGFVESLLSPYVGAGTQGLQCRAICDPFTGERSEYQCGDGETCLFNFPWNANVGHCAAIAEERGIGESCEEPGMSCGQDSICAWDSGGAQCMRFCQFIGQGSDGYEQSTCPTGFTCQPLVNDIGFCD